MRVILLSIDGLQPHHYLRRQSPFEWAAEMGSYSPTLTPVYPTVTYPNHATLATGLATGRHGVASNTRFEPGEVNSWIKGESQSWYFDESLIRAPTLWQLAKSEAHSVALLYWPVSRGATVDWLMPEVFPVGEEAGKFDWSMIAEHSTPPLIHALEQLPEFMVPRSHSELDWVICRAARLLLQAHRPDLIMMHLVSYDHAVHGHGTRSKHAHEALRQISALTLRLLEEVSLEDTAVMIAGDHGFLDFDRRVHINSLLAKHGWLETDGSRITRWDAVAHVCCGQAMIHLRRPGRELELLRFLKLHERHGYRVLTRSDLKALGAATEGAVCALDARPGLSFGQNLKGPVVERLRGKHGEHGYLSTYPEMQAGFVALGPGFAPGFELPPMHITEIAPKIRALLGRHKSDAA